MAKANPPPSLDYLREHFHFSDDGKVFLKKKRFDGDKPLGSEIGSLNTTGYYRVCIFGKHYSLARIVFFHFYEQWPDEIDHIDHDKTNNNPLNLRNVTRSENCINRKTKTHSSKYRGVCWHKVKKKWQAAIEMDGKKVHLGAFDDEDEAYEKYKDAAQRLHGRFNPQT
jgi:hypothetical protein